MRSEILLTLLLLSTIADAILDRVVHNAHRMKLAGESLRKRQRNKITENVESE